jgi:hypothetical protein
MNVQDQMTNLPDPFVVLFLARPEDYAAKSADLLHEFVDVRKMAGICITINRPYASLVSLLKAEKIDTSRMFFIDLITKTPGGSPTRTDKCIFMGSATNLTDLSIAISQAVSANPGEKKFIFLDSLSTMLIYNEAGTLSKFSHFLTSRLRQWNVNGLFMSLDTASDKEVTASLSQFCDRVVQA